MKYLAVMLVLLTGCAGQRVRGVVVDADTRIPIRGAKVMLMYSDVAAGERLARPVIREKLLDTTGRRGAFEFRVSETLRETYMCLFVVAYSYNPAFFEIRRDGRITFQHGNHILQYAIHRDMTVSLKATSGKHPDDEHMAPIYDRWKEKGLIDEASWRMMRRKDDDKRVDTTEEILEEKLRKAQELIEK